MLRSPMLSDSSTKGKCSDLIKRVTAVLVGKSDLMVCTDATLIGRCGHTFLYGIDNNYIIYLSMYAGDLI